MHDDYAVLGASIVGEETLDSIDVVLQQLATRPFGRIECVVSGAVSRRKNDIIRQLLSHWVDLTAYKSLARVSSKCAPKDLAKVLPITGGPTNCDDGQSL